MIVLLILALLLIVFACLLMTNTHNEVVRDKRARNLGGGRNDAYTDRIRSKDGWDG